MLVPDLIKQHFRVINNNATDVHVHIGDGENGFGLETVQRMMGSMHVFDELLAAIHPPSRQDHEYSQNIRAACRHRLRGTLFEALELLELVFGGHRPAVNIKNLCNSSVRGKKAIEFPQHAGALERQRSQAWVQTVGGIVKWCRKVDDNHYFDRVWAYAEQEDEGNFLFPPSPVHLLRDIVFQKPGDFDEMRLAQADGAESEDETVDGYIPFSLGRSIDDSSDSSSDSNATASKVWSSDEEILDV